MTQRVEVSVDTSGIDRGIVYNHKPIDWSDFKGTPEPNSHFSAMIYCGISMKYEYVRKGSETIVDIRLHPYMNNARSWYKDSLANTRLLQHEQGHFDIAALVARELASRIRGVRFSTADFKQELDSLYQCYQGILAQRQAEYDEATHHGIKTEQQLAWNQHLSETMGILALQ